MTSEHMRRALILLFIFNLVLVYQNWETGRKINTLQTSIVETVKVINEAKSIEGRLSASHDLTNERLDGILKCLEGNCKK